MLYAILCEDIKDSLALRQQVRPLHLERLQQLKAQGRLILAGPHPAIESEDPGSAGFSGSLIVAEFENAEAAQTWIDADPYTDLGIFSSVSIKPFKLVLP